MNTAQAVLEGVGSPGVLATVVSADGQVWHGASGEVEPLMPFRCASVTKTFTAAAVLVLVDEGRVSLDASLSGLLPEHAERLVVAGYDPGLITLRHLLWHTSGLPDFAGDPAYLETVLNDPQRVWSREEQVSWSLERQRPVGAPGETFCYSDTGYVLLGAILESVAGGDLNRAYQEILDLAGLGLSSTWLETFGPDVPRAPQWLGPVDTSTFHPSMDLWGGGGLITTTGDLAVFYRALLDGRVVQDVDRMVAPMVTNELAMGAGIFPLPLGDDWWGHTGFWNVCAAAQRGSQAAVAVAVLQRDAELATEVARRLVSS